MKIRELCLEKRTSFEMLLRAFIKKGYKEKAFKMVLKILTRLKFQTKKEPLSFFSSASK